MIKVVAALIERDNKFLIAKRSTGDSNVFGKWEFPGGKVEIGETNEQALEREFKEELKIDVKAHELINVTVDEYDDVIINLSTYRLELISGEPVLTEHINSRWSNIDNIDELEFAKADAPTIDIIKERYL